MEGGSEEAEQQERSPDGGATSGFEALCSAERRSYSVSPMPGVMTSIRALRES
jgi:hypothetical protein